MFVFLWHKMKVNLLSKLMVKKPSAFTSLVEQHCLLLQSKLFESKLSLNGIKKSWLSKAGEDQI